MRKIASFPVVCFGEVLWDILPEGPLPGGAPMNVAYHLKRLGTNSALITKIGIDEYGNELLNVLSQSELPTDFVYTDHNHPTGLVYINVKQDEIAYGIVFPSAWDFIEWKDELEELVSKAQYFVFGSLASRNNISRNTLYQLLENANTKVLDINLRPPHFQQKHVEFLLHKCDILKMNLAELELITEWFSHFRSAEDRMKYIQDTFHIKTLIVTLGSEGALINHEGKFYSHPGYKMTVADTIGSGDAFLAGFLHRLLNGADVGEALKFSCAMGAFIATQQGACPVYEPSQINEIINCVSV